MGLMLLDSASMYFRAFYGVPDRFEGLDGTPVNAVRGFIDAIAGLLNEFRPDELVACWDNDWRPEFRVQLLPSYKAQRVADPADPATEEIPDRLSVQEPVMVAVLAALGFARLGVDGFEADDVIAALTHRSEGPVEIVTGDRDMFQLVDDDRAHRVIYTAKGMRNLQLVDDSWLHSKYSVTGRQYADMAILRGDASDGLPGVPGIGEKTAASLVTRFGDLHAIIEAALDPGSGMAKGVAAKVLASREYLTAADPVVRLHHPVPLPDPLIAPIPDEPADPEALLMLAEHYNLESPVNRMLHAMQQYA